MKTRPVVASPLVAAAMAPPRPSLVATAQHESAALEVLTNPSLLRHVSAFQGGLPRMLFDLWVAHTPEITRRKLTVHSLHRTAKLVAQQQGCMHLLKLFIPIRYWDKTIEMWWRPPLATLVTPAIQFNRPELLLWAIRHAHAFELLQDRPRKWWEQALRCYQPQDVAVLNLLRDHFLDYATPWHDACFAFVDAHLLQWITQNFGALDQAIVDWDVVLRNIAKKAVSRGDLETVQYVVDNYSENAITRETFVAACEHNQVHVLEYLLVSCAERINSFSDALLEAIKNASPEIHAFIAKHANALWPSLRVLMEQVFSLATSECLEWLRTWSAHAWLEKIAQFSIDKLSSKGQALEIIRFLEENGWATASTDAMDLASEHRAWNIVDYLHEYRNEGCTERAIDAVVMHESVERVPFFHETYRLSCSFEAVISATQDQRIEIIRYLHEDTKCVFTTDVMDTAAGRGRLNVVKFLHEHRSEGCTTDAIDRAAAASHVNIVKFLLENRTEGCTVAAVESAIGNRDTEIVRLLFEHKPELFQPSLLPDLLLCGAFDVYGKLSASYPEDVDSAVEQAIFAAGQQVELPTIRYIVDTLGRKELAHRAVDSAASGASLDWLRIVINATGHESCRLSAVRCAVAAQPNRPRGDRLMFISYVIRACSDPSACEVAIAEAKTIGAGHKFWVTELEKTGPIVLLASPTLPMVQDPRTSAWAIKILTNNHYTEIGEFSRCWRSLTWAVRAVYKNDLVMLQVIRDLPPSIVDKDLYYSSLHHTGHGLVSFRGAREAAVRKGNLSILQWLFENITEIPVEPNLLDETVYFHRYKIAEWLVAHHPEACLKFDWSNKGDEPAYCDFGLDCGLLEWLATHDAVREMLPIIDLIDFALRKDDTVPLRRLYECYPELFVPRPPLREVLRWSGSTCTVQFLKAIGWPVTSSEFWWLPPMHPFLRDPRTPKWVFEVDHKHELESGMGVMSWPIRAIRKHDLGVLEVIRDLPPSVHDPFTFDFISPFNFRGAYTTAVRVGDLAIVEWLFENVVDVLVEPTLLGEAIYYHRYEVAEWLVAHHPKACTKVDWGRKGRRWGPTAFGLSVDLLDWLADHDSVRNAICFTGIIDFAARKNDIVSLERLYEWYPELFTPRPELIELADCEECSDAISFLLAIGWDPAVFLECCERTECA